MKILALKGDTLSFNPSFDRFVIESAYQDDAVAAQSEYGGDFRSDLQAFIPREVVESCTTAGCFELPYVKGIHYRFFADPSGGSSDSFTLAGSHSQKGISILDVMREVRPPFNPETVVTEYAELIKAYGSAEVTLDRYGGETFVRLFQSNGIKARHSDKTKSEIYLELLPLLNSNRIQLLDIRKLIVQLCSLERRTRTGGRITVDHPPGAHDDLINSAAGSLLLAQKKRSGFRGIYLDGSFDFSGTDEEYKKREDEIAAKKQLITSVPEKEVNDAVNKYLRRLEKQLLG